MIVAGQRGWRGRARTCNPLIQSQVFCQLNYPPGRAHATARVPSDAGVWWYNRLMSPRSLSAIVLAAGQGTRMRSERPKPLHYLCGRPMLAHVLASLVDLPLGKTVVVVGHGAERVTKKLPELAPPGVAARLEFVEQRIQRGTGDAVSVALTAHNHDDDDDIATAVVLPGDTPLVQRETITAFVAAHEASGDAATVLTAHLADPTGYGRVVRTKDGRVSHIVEQRDASLEELAVDEVNTSIYCFRLDLLRPALRRLTPDNTQGEYYLTDVVGVLRSAGHAVGAYPLADPVEVMGVNDRIQLAAAEAELRARTNRRWLLAGVTMVDPGRTAIDVTVELATDVTLFPGATLQGATRIGAGSEIGPDAQLVDTVVGADAVVHHTVARSAAIGDGARVGPYAALEPGSIVGAGAHTGPFYTGSAD